MEGVSPATAKYDVFISHCGADTKRNFASCLRDELTRNGLRCFLDEGSLQLGDNAKAKMLHAMHTAEYGVVILSPGFFAQEWCMKELQTFAERGRLVPIFFPAFEDVQKAKAAAIERQAWRRFEEFAMSEEEYLGAVNAHVTGARLESVDGFWNVCIRRVTLRLLDLLGRKQGGAELAREELLIGRDEHFRNLKRLLGVSVGGTELEEVVNLQLSPEAREVGIVGVKGMGGVGKSTIAKKLYDDSDVRSHFGGNICWVKVGQNLSEEKVCSLQKQILYKLNHASAEIWNPREGRELIQNSLRGKRVLICLDDVWESTLTEDMQVLEVQDLSLGSRILKTSRNREAIDGEPYDLDILEPGHAWELFCWHAFDGQLPPPNLEEQARAAVLRCGGLPLAVKILGSSVKYEKQVEDKKRVLEGMLAFETGAPAMARCREVLMYSYDNLPSDPPGLKDAFLLIVGIWPNNKRFREQEPLLENLGAALYWRHDWRQRQHLAQAALKELCNRSLIELYARPGLGDWLDDSNFSIVTVHDLVVDLSSLLIEQSKGRFLHWLGDADTLPFTVSPSHGRASPRSLFGASPLQSLESLVVTCDQDHLRGLDMSEALIDNVCRLLIVEHGLRGQYLFPVLPFKYLTVLRLWYCWVPQSMLDGLEGLVSLAVLQLTGCAGFEKLPGNWSRLQELRSLAILATDELTGTLPAEWKGLTCLKVLCISYNSLSGAPPAEWAALTCLEKLDLSTNRLSGGLPPAWAALESLKALDLSNNELCGVLPEEWAALRRLERLNLSYNELGGLVPAEWTGLSSLRWLDLSFNMLIEELPAEWALLTKLTTVLGKPTTSPRLGALQTVHFAASGD